MCLRLLLWGSVILIAGLTLVDVTFHFACPLVRHVLIFQLVAWVAKPHALSLEVLMVDMTRMKTSQQASRDHHLATTGDC
jgi:hypothetical protein